jgi:hypothetical protein
METGSDVKDEEQMFAWTTLTDDPTSTSALRDLICGSPPYRDVCNENIYTTMGTNTDAMRDFESLMYDTTYDKSNKEIVGGRVTGWWVIVPVTHDCPPGRQGHGVEWDPKLTDEYAWIRIKAICVPGTQGCKNADSVGSVCAPYPNNVIVVDRIACINCDDYMPGLKPVLVK